jgi:alkylhydroperoxidase family enzyme
MARLPFVTGDDATPEQAAALDAVRERRGFVSNVHRSLVHSVTALEAFERFSMHVNGESRLDVRTRELAILRVSQLVGNLYEWRRHVPKAIDAGLTAEQLGSLDRWRDAGFDEREQAVLELVDEHVAAGATTDATVAAVRAAYGEELLVEILFTIGWYLLVSALILPLDVVADDPEPAGLAVPFTPAAEVAR